MTPRHFSILAAAALASLILAIATYTSSAPWTAAGPAHAKLVPGLAGDAGKVQGVDITKGSSTIRLKRDGETWRLAERDGYPVSTEKVRALLLAVSGAELAEPKTSKSERYKVLEIEDPSEKGANSHHLKLSDAAGAALAEMIVGKKRLDAFGSGKAGTYVRKPGEAQSWLVSTEIDTSASIKDWIKTKIFEQSQDKIRRIVLEVPREEPIEIAWDGAAQRQVLKNIPAGKKVRYANAVDDIAKAISSFTVEDVRKLADTPAGDSISTATVEVEGGLRTTFKVRRTPDGDWLSLNAAGEGESKALADALSLTTAGWEFKLPNAKAGDIFKTRAQLLEEPNEPEPGPGAGSKPAAGPAPDAPAASSAPAAPTPPSPPAP